MYIPANLSTLIKYAAIVKLNYLLTRYKLILRGLRLILSKKPYIYILYSIYQSLRASLNLEIL